MTITAKYPGQCRKCGGAIAVGAQIEWERGAGATHITCPITIPADAIRISGGSGYGYHGWTEGQVIHNNSPYARDKGEPEYLYVLSCRSRYYREDGMSFGVGDDSGHVYSAVCRAATDDESAALRAEIARAEIRTAAEAELSALVTATAVRDHYVTDGSQPVGERILDTQTIYGGGDWWVISPDRIWYVRNNGADGDDWSRNNVQTGGAGAIGYAVPHTPKLEAHLRRIASVLAS